MAKERQCIVCGKKYEYCPHCNKSNSNESWKMIYCDENCMGLNEIRDQYKVGKLTKSEAQLKANSYKIPSQFKDWCRPTFEDMFAVDFISTYEENNLTNIIEDESPIIVPEVESLAEDNSIQVTSELTTNKKKHRRNNIVNEIITE